MEQLKSPGALYADLGLSLNQAGRYGEAIEALKSALKEAPTDFSYSQVYLTLGRTYKALNQTDEAVKALAEATRLDPNMVDMVREEVISLHWDLQLVRKQPAEARSGTLWSVLDSIAQTVLPKAQPIVRKLAFDLVEKRRYDVAERLLKLINASAPNDADVLEHLGKALLGQGKLPESLNAFQKAISIDSQRASAYGGLGQAAYQLTKHSEAVDAFDHALELDPNDVSALYNRGLALRALGKLEESEYDLSSALRLDPSNQLIYRDLAMTQQKQGKPAEAARTLTAAATLCLERGSSAEAQSLAEEAIRLDPRNGQTHLQLGRALARQKRYDEARAELGRASKLEPTAEAFIEIARICQSETAFHDALKAVNKALNRAPDSIEALTLKGLLLRELGRYKDALAILDQALARDPGQIEAHFEKGAVLEAMGRAEQALSAYQHVVELDGSYGPAFARLGDLRLLLGRYQDVVAALDRALALAPSAGLHRSKGEALYYLDRLEDALSAFDEAIRLDPNDACAYRYRGSALRKLGKYEHAITAFQLAIELGAALEQEEDAWAYAELGECLRSLNRFREAKPAFQKAITRFQEAKPAFQKAATYQKQYAWALARYGETLRVLKKHDKAIKYLKEATRLEPNDWWSYGAYGSALVDRQQYRSAIAAFGKAIQLNPNDSWSLGMKAVIFRVSRMHKQALKTFDQALEIDPEVGWIMAQKGAILLQKKTDGDLAQALQLLQDAVQREPNNSWIYYQLGYCRYLLNHYEEAIYEIDKAISLDPDVRVYNVVKRMALDELGRPDEALKAHDQALSLPVDANTYIERGAEYQAIRAYDYAIEDFKEANQHDPNNAQAYNALAWIYVEYLNDHLEEATELAQKAVGLARQAEDARIEASSLDTLAWSYYKRGLHELAISRLKEAMRKDDEDLEIRHHYKLCRRAVRRAARAKGNSALEEEVDQVAS